VTDEDIPVMNDRREKLAQATTTARELRQLKAFDRIAESLEGIHQQLGILRHTRGSTPQEETPLRIHHLETDKYRYPLFHWVTGLFLCTFGAIGLMVGFLIGLAL
jgi:hypothetical protein